ncbi:MAG: FMN-binding protein [Cetobacterium sp.]
MIKKVLCMSALVSSVAVASKGEFIGSGKGYNGEIKVKVSGENNQIKEIEVIKHEESGFTRRAMKKISDEIITTQSLDVDNIAGATYTSEGLKEAVAKAIASSGIILNKVAVKNKMTSEYKDIDTDVVIVDALSSTLENMGVETRTNSKVVNILMENNKISGVEVETNGKKYKVNAKAVVMATGGFC